MGQQKKIVAVITTKKESILPGGAPVFIAESRELLQTVSFILEKALDAPAHEVDPDTIIIVAQ